MGYIFNKKFVMDYRVSLMKSTAIQQTNATTVSVHVVGKEMQGKFMS